MRRVSITAQYVAARVRDLLKAWEARELERATLRAMNDWQLRQHGLSREMMTFEADKPIWRP